MGMLLIYKVKFKPFGSSYFKWRKLLYAWKRPYVICPMSHGSSKNLDTMLSLICDQHTLRLKASMKGDVLCDDTRQQNKYEFKVGNIDLKVITAGCTWSWRESTKWKDVNSKNKRSFWRRHIFIGVMRNVR